MGLKIVELDFVENKDLRNEIDYYKKIENKILNYYSGLNNNEFTELYYASELYKYKDNFGYVYFLLNKHNGLIKIGKTKKLKERINTFRRDYKNLTGQDSDFEILALMYSHKCILSKLEKELHDELRKYNTHGEWFCLKDVDINNYFPFETAIMVNGIPVSVDDVHDHHLYPVLEKSTSISEKEIDELIFSIKNKSYNYKIKKPEIKFIETCIKENVGFDIEKYDKINNKMSKITFYPENNEIFNINKLKSKNINISEIDYINKLINKNNKNLKGGS